MGVTLLIYLLLLASSHCISVGDIDPIIPALFFTQRSWEQPICRLHFLCTLG